MARATVSEVHHACSKILVSDKDNEDACTHLTHWTDPSFGNLRCWMIICFRTFKVFKKISENQKVRHCQWGLLNYWAWHHQSQEHFLDFPNIFHFTIIPFKKVVVVNVLSTSSVFCNLIFSILFWSSLKTGGLQRIVESCSSHSPNLHS